MNKKQKGIFESIFSKDDMFDTRIPVKVVSDLLEKYGEKALAKGTKLFEAASDMRSLEDYVKEAASQNEAEEVQHAEGGSLKDVMSKYKLHGQDTRGIANEEVVNVMQFNGESTFEAIDMATKWLHKNGYSYGSMQRNEFIGVKKGDYHIEKWRNLQEVDRSFCDGVIVSNDFREGTVYVFIFGKEEVANDDPESEEETALEEKKTPEEETKIDQMPDPGEEMQPIEEEVNEEEAKDTYKVIARGVSDKNMADQIARNKQGKVITDPDSEDKFMVVLSEAEDTQGARDGSGPHKDSAQTEISDEGKRKQAGEDCPGEEVDEGTAAEPVKGFYTTDTLNSLESRIRVQDNTDEALGRLLAIIQYLVPEDVMKDYLQDGIAEKRGISQALLRAKAKLHDVIEMFSSKDMEAKVIQHSVDLYREVLEGTKTANEAEEIVADAPELEKLQHPQHKDLYYDNKEGKYYKEDIDMYASTVEQEYIEFPNGLKVTLPSVSEEVVVADKIADKELASQLSTKGLTQVTQNDDGSYKVVGKSLFKPDEVKEMLTAVRDEYQKALDEFKATDESVQKNLDNTVRDILEVKNAELLEKKLQLLDKLNSAK